VALDEAYGLSKMGHKVKILILDSERSIDRHTFLEIESGRIKQHEVDVEFIGDRLLMQILELFTHKRLGNDVSLFISHSLRATVLCKLNILKISRRKNLYSTIHQLPTLSRPIQRLKRFCYAQFTDVLFAYSHAVKQDWEDRASRNFLSRAFFKKEILLNRNGIYLHRLPRRSEVNNVSANRLIFLGRNTNWKGLNTFIDLAKTKALKSYDLLLIIPDFTILDFKEIAPELSHRVQLVTSSKLEDYTPRHGDVHIYPVNYGSSAKFIESISLNCLEMACLGVPSVVTKGGLSTWQDLKEFGIFVEVDWDELDLASKQIDYLSRSQSYITYHADLTSRIRIENHLEVYAKFLSRL